MRDRDRVPLDALTEVPLLTLIWRRRTHRVTRARPIP
jgi:hypothetical protein